MEMDTSEREGMAGRCCECEGRGRESVENKAHTTPTSIIGVNQYIGWLERVGREEGLGIIMQNSVESKHYKRKWRTEAEAVGLPVIMTKDERREENREFCKRVINK